MSQPTSRLALAILCGGALCVSTAADAGLTVTSAYFDLNAGGVTAQNFDPSAIHSPLNASGAGSSLTYTGLQHPGVDQYGFSVSAIFGGGDPWSVFGATLGFTTNSNLTVRLSGNVSSEAATVFLVNVDTNSAIFLRASGDGLWDSGDIQLAAGGNYLVGVNGPLTFANAGTETGIVLDFVAVPAPGAAALVGLAGLMSRRRRS
jgi:hypothetical protein